MVIEDVWQRTKESIKKKGKKLERPAFPIGLPFDRLAANIADLVLFVPLVSVALALLRKQMVLAQLVGTEPELHAYAVFYFLSVVVLGTLYQIFFLALVGATPGKFFFGLRVWNVWTKKRPDLQKVVLRSILWWVDLFLLLPLLALFFDSHRRPIHDRLSDTVVVNQRDRNAGLPSRFEAGFSRGLFAASIVSVAFLMITHTWQDYQRTGELGRMLQRWAGGTPYCKDIDQAVVDWPTDVAVLNSDTTEKERRLLIAMALFASGDISEECLDFEADALVWIDGIGRGPQALAYLAKAFSKMDSGLESNLYLDKVCELGPESEACRVIGLIEHFLGDSAPIEAQSITKVLKEVPHDFVKVWVIRYYYKTAQLEPMQKLLDELSLNRPLSQFLTEFRIKSLWRMGRHHDAEMTFAQYWENSRRKATGGLSWWLCDQQLMSSCENHDVPSCRVFSEKYQEIRNSSYEVYADLTYFKRSQCQPGLFPQPGNMPPELLTYVDQYRLGQTSKQKTEDLLRIALHGQYSLKIRQDAALRALSLAELPAEIKEFSEFFTEQKQFRWPWYIVGEKLYERFIDWKKFAQASRIADRLHEWVKSKENFRRRVFSHYQAGHEKKAWKIWNQAKKNSLRRPASISEQKRFLQVERKLELKYGAK